MIADGHYDLLQGAVWAHTGKHALLDGFQSFCGRMCRPAAYVLLIKGLSNCVCC